MMQYQKVKSAEKEILGGGRQLAKLVLQTMGLAADVVGSTLGPGGRGVLIERGEGDLPPMITKDGVTVFKNLGLSDPTAHCVLEAMRDAAQRTANEAGDGTTTATVLAHAVALQTDQFCQANPRVSPQKVVRRLEEMFRDVVEPKLRSWAIPAKPGTPEGEPRLRSVALVSANGDADLADAVMRCYEEVGDEGNVTIAEVSGAPHYEVERISGYPVGIGYEESCHKWFPKFITDPGRQLCQLKRPVFLLYYGSVDDPIKLLTALRVVGDEYEKHLKKEAEYDHGDVVVVATNFSEKVLGMLALNFPLAGTLNVFPLLAPKTIQLNGQVEFLGDLSAITGARVLDPINRPLERAKLEDFGPGVDAFEASRWRSTIFGYADEEAVLNRSLEIETQITNASSTLDAVLLQERRGKLTGGLARLKVFGTSNAEIKEKRDRAEDAVCSVRGAIKHGCLPGGGWSLLKLERELAGEDRITEKVLRPALLAPFYRLLTNSGLVKEEVDQVRERLVDEKLVYDASRHQYGDPFELGVLDSLPAVLEAIRNSLTIAGSLGTLGGTVVYKRDYQLERSEARSVADFMRDIDEGDRMNEADQRG